MLPYFESRAWYQIIKIQIVKSLGNLVRLLLFFLLNMCIFGTVTLRQIKITLHLKKRNKAKYISSTYIGQDLKSSRLSDKFKSNFKMFKIFEYVKPC